MVYVSGTGVSREVSAIYVSPDGSARKVVTAYCGDANGRSQLVYSSVYRVLIRNMLTLSLRIRTSLSSSDKGITLAAGESAVVEPMRTENGYELMLGKQTILKTVNSVTSVWMKQKNGTEQMVSNSGTENFSREQYGVYLFDGSVAEIDV